MHYKEHREKWSMRQTRPRNPRESRPNRFSGRTVRHWNLRAMVESLATQLDEEWDEVEEAHWSLGRDRSGNYFEMKIVHTERRSDS